MLCKSNLATSKYMESECFKKAKMFWVSALSQEVLA